MCVSIDITTVLGTDLRSRSAVGDLALLIRNMNTGPVVVDFANVRFATRGFIDEFSNTFLKDKTPDIELANVPEDIQVVFEVVSRTQNKEKTVVSDKATVVKFRNVADVNSYLRTLPI